MGQHVIADHTARARALTTTASGLDLTRALCFANSLLGAAVELNIEVIKRKLGSIAV